MRSPARLARAEWASCIALGTRGWTAAPRGKRFLVGQLVKLPTQPLTLVPNWTASLQK